jgi:hypothetical protein
MAHRVRSLALVITASLLEVELECLRAYIGMVDEDIDYYIYTQMYFLRIPITTMSLRMRRMGESGACCSTISRESYS